MKFDYGGREAERGRVYAVGDCGKLKVVDVFDEFWDAWRDANVVFIDFPYDNRMIKHYYRQIDRETDKTFSDLMQRAFEIINEIDPDRVFVEIGSRNLSAVVDEMSKLRYKVKPHPCFYAKTNPCFIVEGCRRSDSLIDYQISDMDELKSIDEICAHEKGCICDFFNGQGAVSLSAYKHGRAFVCSELNPNRLGNALTKLEKAGAVIR